MFGAMNITEYLSANSLSQEAWATRLGVSQGRVSQWIAGQTIPPERAEQIEVDTAGSITVEELRPDLKWQRDDTGKVLGHLVKSRAA